MKNCDEMVSSLLERRDRYAAAQKRKRALLTRTLSAAFCVCLVTLLGFGLWQGGMFRPMAALPDQPVDTPTENDKIVINAMGDVSVNRSKMSIGLLGEDFVEMTREEMAAYYGVDYFPEVPADLTAWADERRGIYRRSGGTGEVYWDVDILNYSNADFTRNVHLEVDKGQIIRDCYYFDGAEETSLIHQVEVLIGRTDHGYYYAEFTYQGVSFLLDANGLTQDEFVAVIASLID